MIKEGLIHSTFNTIRGTPQYWSQMQKDMLAKIKTLGPYTFFLTGSAADFHWPELIQIVAKQYGENLTLEAINNMDAKTKRNWLARNLVTVARQIDYIFRKLWKVVILSGVHPIGQILNYDIRKEMQNRGTAHFHSAVHVKDAPTLDNDSDQQITVFVNRFITCELPDEQDDPVLHDLVKSRQSHHHTRSCKKKVGVPCRFLYPKPPLNNTIIVRPSKNIPSNSMNNMR